MKKVTNVNDYERCPKCGKLFDRSSLAEVMIHMHADLQISKAVKKIKGKEVK